MVGKNGFVITDDGRSGLVATALDAEHDESVLHVLSVIIPMTVEHTPSGTRS
jgi:hypothetical protein